MKGWVNLRRTISLAKVFKMTLEEGGQMIPKETSVHGIHTALSYTEMFKNHQTPLE